jgi:hypothetical protein
MAIHRTSSGAVVIDHKLSPIKVLSTDKPFKGSKLVLSKKESKENCTPLVSATKKLKKITQKYERFIFAQVFLFDFFYKTSQIISIFLQVKL